MEKEKILYRGAEAILIQKESILVKRRIKKSYRLKEIDEKLRKLRTRKEGKLLEKAGEIISVPNVLKVDEKSREIEMEIIHGKKLSQALDNFSLEEQKEICFKIGEEVSKLHENDVIHGDLTTSNMICKERFLDNQPPIIYFFDFGLSFISIRLEDKAVDLHLLKQALEARHFLHWKELFEEVKRGYKEYKDSEKVLLQLEKVERRGRYKN